MIHMIHSYSTVNSCALWSFHIPLHLCSRPTTPQFFFFFKIRLSSTLVKATKNLWYINQSQRKKKTRNTFLTTRSTTTPNTKFKTINTILEPCNRFTALATVYTSAILHASAKLFATSCIYVNVYYYFANNKSNLLCLSLNNFWSL